MMGLIFSRVLIMLARILLLLAAGPVDAAFPVRPAA